MPKNIKVRRRPVVLSTARKTSASFPAHHSQSSISIISSNYKRKYQQVFANNKLLALALQSSKQELKLYQGILNQLNDLVIKHTSLKSRVKERLNNAALHLSKLAEEIYGAIEIVDDGDVSQQNESSESNIVTTVDKNENIFKKSPRAPLTEMSAIMEQSIGESMLEDEKLEKRISQLNTLINKSSEIIDKALDVNNSFEGNLSWNDNEATVIRISNNDEKNKENMVNITDRRRKKCNSENMEEIINLDSTCLDVVDMQLTQPISKILELYQKQDEPSTKEDQSMPTRRSSVRKSIVAEQMSSRQENEETCTPEPAAQTNELKNPSPPQPTKPRRRKAAPKEGIQEESAQKESSPTPTTSKQHGPGSHESEETPSQPKSEAQKPTKNRCSPVRKRNPSNFTPSRSTRSAKRKVQHLEEEEEAISQKEPSLAPAEKKTTRQMKAAHKEPDVSHEEPPSQKEKAPTLTQHPIKAAKRKSEKNQSEVSSQVAVAAAQEDSLPTQQQAPSVKVNPKKSKANLVEPDDNNKEEEDTREGLMEPGRHLSLASISTPRNSMDEPTSSRSRRSRPSVNYAEPNLIAKMRRESMGPSWRPKKTKPKPKGNNA